MKTSRAPWPATFAAAAPTPTLLARCARRGRIRRKPERERAYADLPVRQGLEYRKGAKCSWAREVHCRGHHAGRPDETAGGAAPGPGGYQPAAAGKD